MRARAFALLPLFAMAIVVAPAGADEPPAYIARNKTTVDEARVGSVATYEIVVFNEQNTPITLDLRETLPAQFTYVAGSALRDGTEHLEPAVEDSTLSWGSLVVDYRLDVSFDVEVGDLEGLYETTAELFTDGVLIDAETSDALYVRAPTKLVAHGWILDTSGAGSAFPDVTATLTKELTGDPMPGRDIRFTGAGYVLCSATTDEQGLARCSPDAAAIPRIVAGVGFDAAASLDYLYYPSSSHGPLVG
jgi:uncharacterized repeat protein (TIGR01451 family)